MRGLWKLTWLETKIFLREPMGVFGSVGMPVIVFLAFTRFVGTPRLPRRVVTRVGFFDPSFLPVFASMLIAVSAVMSLVTIISIYREGGILKRLRATPLRPQTILTAHVLVKLLFTLVTMVLLVVAGRRYYPPGAGFPLRDFAAALLFTTCSVLSMGFLIASIAPTARMAQPLAAAILYPMLGVSGLFVPIDVLPAGIAAVARVLPLTHAASLLTGIWRGDGWGAHTGDLAALAATFVVCMVLSSIVFRWE